MLLKVRISLYTRKQGAPKNYTSGRTQNFYIKSLSRFGAMHMAYLFLKYSHEIVNILRVYPAFNDEKWKCSADLQIYICGDLIMTATEYAELQGSRSSCISSCSLSSIGVSGASQYYWSLSDWGNCMAPCGGSTQERTASCMNSIDKS